MLPLLGPKLVNEPLLTLISPTEKSVVGSVEVNVNAMDVFLVLEPLVTPGVVDVMVMLGGGGRTNVAVVFPKNDLFVPVNEVETPLIVCCAFMVTTRFTLV